MDSVSLFVFLYIYAHSEVLFTHDTKHISHLGARQVLFFFPHYGITWDYGIVIGVFASVHLNILQDPLFGSPLSIATCAMFAHAVLQYKSSRPCRVCSCGFSL
jgi:hypothetical protein